MDELLVPQKEFDTIIKKLFLCDAEPVSPELRLLYLAFAEDQPLIERFAHVLVDQITNYVIPVNKRNKIFADLKSGIDISMLSKLFIEARAAFIKYNPNAKNQNRYTEVGELISFCLANSQFEAVQLASKMALKTNSEMPVYGLDGIHGKINKDGSLTIFFIEAKVTDDLESGIDQLGNSIEKFNDKDRIIRNEYRIINDLSNLDALQGQARIDAMEYFNPYSSSSCNIRERYIGSIIYSADEYKNKVEINDDEPIDIHELNFTDQIQLNKDNIKETIKKKLSKINNIQKVRVALIAIPNVDELKSSFAKALSGEHIRD